MLLEMHWPSFGVPILSYSLNAPFVAHAKACTYSYNHIYCLNASTLLFVK